MYPVLQIDPARYLDAYNLDIDSYVERHTFKETAQKGSKQINYMSYSHAYRLFRIHFPELEVQLEENPNTGGYIFEEINERGYFLKAFVYTAEGVPFSDTNNGMRIKRSASIYYPVLSVSGLSVYPNELETTKNYTTNKTEEKPGKYVANIQLFNKANQRAIVKAIALTTGIGLKLWTGDDLNEDIVDAKFSLLDAVSVRAREYTKLTGIEYTPSVSHLDTITVITEEGKSIKRMMDAFKAAIAVPTVTSEPEVISTETKPAETTKTTKTNN
jgi:hypothetical protein